MVKDKLKFHPIVFGCDPEYFFRSGKSIVGSENLIPRSGLLFGEDSKMVIDGVQAEMNPAPSNCREMIGREIARGFVAIREHLKTYKDIKIDFSQTIELSDQDFDSLSDNCKKFGCMPSKNYYDGGKNGYITVDPTVYRHRSAGGHLHLGSYTPEVRLALKKDHMRVMRMLDILVGNTSVLLDRDPGNIERRKVYGKAGEFRTPSHGLEYRTLSNFWLSDYTLMSLVMGLARHAVIIVVNDMDGEFEKLVDMDDIAKAINTNNFALALRNFKKIEKTLMAITPSEDAYPINPSNIKEFKHFFKKGLNHWYTGDIIESWSEILDGASSDMIGFGDYLATTVREDMLNSKD